MTKTEPERLNPEPAVVPCLGGQRGYASIPITPIPHIVTPVSPLIKLLTKSS